MFEALRQRNVEQGILTDSPTASHIGQSALSTWRARLDIFWKHVENLHETFMLFICLVTFVIFIGESCHGNGRHGIHD